MLCFVDESGDPGLKVGHGSSKYFTVAIVLFEDNDEAVACDNRITRLRDELHLPSDFEFHFSKTSRDKKKAFFEAVIQFNFFYMAMTINKSALYGEGFRFKNSFYKYTCGLVFENAKPYLKNAIVVFDGSGSRKFKQELQTYLKKKINQKEYSLIQKVKIQNSSSNNLIQLADMICGAIADAFKVHHKSEIRFRQIISCRELLCQVWPHTVDEKKKRDYLKSVRKKKRSEKK